MKPAECALCGQTEARILYRGTDRLYKTTSHIFNVVSCNRCGMSRLHPRPADPGLHYPRQYWLHNGTAGSYRRLVLRHHLRFVFQALGTGRRVLDAGSGGGLLAAMLSEKGVQAVALDISPAAAALAAREGGLAVAADFAAAPFAPASWDLIALFHVLEHVPDPRAHLATAHRLLAKDARLVVAVPAFDSLQRRFFGTRWNGLDIPRHLHHFRESDLRVLLAQSGFRVLRITRFSWRDSPAGLATSLFPSLDPMSRLARKLRPNPAALGLYAALTALAAPLALLEAALGYGSVVMVDAVRREPNAEALD